VEVEANRAGPIEHRLLTKLDIGCIAKPASQNGKRLRVRLEGIYKGAATNELGGYMADVRATVDR
jgi:hypothetical protein